MRKRSHAEKKSSQSTSRRGPRPRGTAPQTRPAGWEAAENATRLAWSVTRRRTNKSTPKSNGHRARWARTGAGARPEAGRASCASQSRGKRGRPPRARDPRLGREARRCRLSAQGRRAPTAQTGARPGAGGHASPRDANRADDKRGCVARTTTPRARADAARATRCGRTAALGERAVSDARRPRRTCSGRLSRRKKSENRWEALALKMFTGAFKKGKLERT